MKRLLSLLLCCCLALAGCASDAPTTELVAPESYSYPAEFESANDPEIIEGLEESIYLDLIDSLDSNEYMVDKVEVAHVSKEYLDELNWNSQENVFFGYTLSDIKDYFGDTPYVFTVEEGQTIAKPFESYDETWEMVATNVATGTGVILVLVTVSAVAPAVGAPAAITAIFTFATEGAVAGAVIDASISGAVTGIVTGVETGDIDEALKSATLAASEGYKMGAIIGAATGGAAEGIGLLRASRNGLTMSEAAAIQMESKLPLSIIKDMRNMEEYEVYKSAGLKACTVKTPQGTRTVLARDLDMARLDENGLTNYQRMQKGLNPLDENGVPFEYHHVGQKNDGALALLSRSEHDMPGLHFNQESEIERQLFNSERAEINRNIIIQLYPSAKAA